MSTQPPSGMSIFFKNIPFLNQFCFFFVLSIFFRTGFIEVCIGTSKQEADKMFDGMGSKYPIGRVGEVSDTSAAIAFLADDSSASFLTGILLPVDGIGLYSFFSYFVLQFH